MDVLRRARAAAEAGLRHARRVYVVDVLWRAYRDFARDNGTMYAAAMSYYVLFSLFPLLIFLVAVFGVVIRDAEIQGQVVDAIVEQIPEEVNLRNQVERVISGVSRTNNGLLGLIGVLGTAWTASGMFGALRRALNNAFDVPGSRPFVHAKAADLLSILGVMGLVVLSIGMTTALGVFRALASDLFAGVLVNLVWGLIYFLLPLGISFVVFLTVYRLIPNRTVGLADLWVGALMAAVGFEVAKAGFSLYLANFGRYQEVYGTLGGVVAFLFFVFIVANIVIFSAEVASELGKDRALRRQAAAAPEPTGGTGAAQRASKREPLA